MYFENLPRNIAATSSRSYEQYSLYWWSGLVSKVVTNESQSSLLTTRLTRGYYKLRFSALKHFGNFSQTGDFEVYYSPSFYWIY